MAIIVEAVYENGVLKPSAPLPFKEHEKVQITIQTVTSPLLAGYGLMGFTGNAEEANYFASDPDLDYPQASEKLGSGK
jgi:predicted DNA-binding antitoxin AbrB/MazE fold protein